MIPVSPAHEIELAPALFALVERPPDKDYVLRSLATKKVNGQPLIQSEIVIAGAETRRLYPLAEKYPVHFRKTYYPICFHQDPAHEFENQLRASRIIPVTEPIGSTRTSFRSCFLPGKPLDQLSPFGVEPEEQNIRIARETEPALLIGLWTLLENIHTEVKKLHRNDFAHGDLFLHNIIVSLSPLAPHLIDFEQAVLKSDLDNAQEWEKRCAEDLRWILREAIFVQCGLGPQKGALAEESHACLPQLVDNPDTFLRRIESGGKWSA